MFNATMSEALPSLHLLRVRVAVWHPSS